MIGVRGLTSPQSSGALLSLAELEDFSSLFSSASRSHSYNVFTLTLFLELFSIFFEADLSVLEEGKRDCSSGDLEFCLFF